MITFTLDTDEMEKALDWFEREQLPFVLQNTMNQLAFGMNQMVRKGMDKHYEGGATRWSKSGVRVQKATKRNLYAAVYTDSSRPYLGTTIYGGVVNPFHGMKYLVKPAAQTLNKFGNIPRGTLSKKAQNKKKYFVGRPTGAKRNQPHGLYETFKRKAPKLIMDLGDKNRYQKGFFPAPDIAAKYFRQQWFKIYEAQFRKAMKTAIPKRRPTGF